MEAFASGDVVGNRFKLSAPPANNREGIVQRGLLGGMSRDVAVELFLRQIFREKVAARRPGRRSDKGCIIPNQIEAAAIDSQKAAQLDVARRGAAGQRVIQL